MAKRGSSSLDTTLSEIDKASNTARNNKAMKRDGRTYRATSQNSANADENEWSRISFATPSFFPRGSQMRPYFDADSVILRDSTLIGVPPLNALNSTEQSTISRIDNAANELRNMARGESPATAPNDNRGAHQSRPLPINGRTYHGRSIDVSSGLLTQDSITKQQRSMNSYLLNKLALNSTARSIVAQSELKCDKEATNAPRMNASHRSTTVNNKKASSIPQKIAPTEKPRRNVDATSAQLSNIDEDDGEIQSHNISVQLFTKPRNQAPQKPSTSNDAAIVNWMDELTRYWCHIEDQTKSALKLIKQDRIRRGLAFDAKFKNRFMDSVYKKILITFEQFLLNEHCFDNFFDTTFVSTDTNQGDLIDQANHSNGDDIHGIELDDSLVCHQVPPVMLSDIQENKTESTVDEIAAQICNDDTELGQQVEDQQETGEKISEAEIPETIELDLDQEEAVDQGGNDDDQDMDDIAGQSKPTIQQEKRRKNNVAKTKGNLKKKSKLNDAADTLKRHKCDFCEYSTDKKSSLTDHIRTHTNERPFECEICDKQLSRKDALNRHMKTHREMFAFQCLNCRQGFPNRKQQKLHEKRCKAKGYQCYLCKHFSANKRDLVDHMRGHTGEKLRCSMCRKQFSSNRSLTRHMKSHGNLFRFQCSKCGQGFSHKAQWKSHESRCKLKQFECYLCNKKFYQEKSHLLQHMRHKHTGEKPFGCSDCPMRFCTKSERTKHMKRLHKKRI